MCFHFRLGKSPRKWSGAVHTPCRSMLWNQFPSAATCCDNSCRSGACRNGSSPFPFDAVESVMLAGEVSETVPGRRTEFGISILWVQRARTDTDEVRLRAYLARCPNCRQHTNGAVCGVTDGRICLLGAEEQIRCS